MAQPPSGFGFDLDLIAARLDERAVLADLSGCGRRDRGCRAGSLCCRRDLSGDASSETPPFLATFELLKLVLYVE